MNAELARKRPAEVVSRKPYVSRDLEIRRPTKAAVVTELTALAKAGRIESKYAIGRDKHTGEWLAIAQLSPPQPSWFARNWWKLCLTAIACMPLLWLAWVLVTSLAAA